jgi:transposase
MYYVGLDVHKKTVSYCVKTGDGSLVQEGTVAATRAALTSWAEHLPKPWSGALEATLFTGWIYDHVQSYAQQLKVAHPVMLKAIAASKKKNDRVDASKISDLVRCNLLPECYIAPRPLRELRRVLRYRNLVVRQAVRMKNKISGLLLETGTPHNKEKLHGRKYFQELLDSLEEVPDSVVELLRLTRSSWEAFHQMEQKLTAGLSQDPELAERVARLRTIPGVGQITALTWALEVGEPQRFATVGQAVSYCGLCSAQRESAGHSQRGPLSKQRNKHLQSILIEAAKLAPRWSPRLTEVHARELQRGNRNRATLAVARKLVAYLLAVERSGKAFQSPAPAPPQTT